MSTVLRLRAAGLVAGAAALLLTGLTALTGCSDHGPAEPSAVVSSLGAQARQPTASASPDAGTLPRLQHVVVVVEENHAESQVIGSRSAPYLNSLARQGASFTSSYGEYHPSQPNYLALFSGSTQGLGDDSCPHRFSGPNLGSQLLSAGLTFTGYADSLPHTGYLGCTSGDYARKHAPWTDFPALPASVDQPWSRHPADWSALPTVSFVIPDLQHDMHDGTVRQADDWLRANLGGYVQWARSHDSVLLVTWDEDDDTPANRIPTLIVGAHVRPGVYTEAVDHYRLLRTIEALYGLPTAGQSARRAPITDIWQR